MLYLIQNDFIDQSILEYTYYGVKVHFTHFFTLLAKKKKKKNCNKNLRAEFVFREFRFFV